MFKSPYHTYHNIYIFLYIYIFDARRYSQDEKVMGKTEANGTSDGEPSALDMDFPICVWSPGRKLGETCTKLWA